MVPIATIASHNHQLDIKKITKSWYQFLSHIMSFSLVWHYDKQLQGMVNKRQCSS